MSSEENGAGKGIRVQTIRAKEKTRKIAGKSSARGEFCGIMAEASKELMRLVTRLDSGNAREVAAAREELEQAGPLAVTRLVAELQKTPKAGKRLSMLLLGLRIVLLPALLVGVVVAAVLALIVATDGSGCIGDLGCLGDLFTGWNLREQYHENLHQRQWNQIARALAQLNDLRVAGPLAEALAYADDNTRPILMTALYRLTPQFDAEHARALTPEQRGALYHLLEDGLARRDSCDVNLAIAVLRVSVLAEDVQAIDMAQRIAAVSPVRKVAATAAQAAEQLRAIEQRLQISQSLLRGARAPAVAPEMLLRPASGSIEATPQSEQLLRAAPSDTFMEHPDAK